MVADADGGAELPVLDKQLLNGEAAESGELRRDFNPDPRIADFKDGEDALAWMMGGL